MGSLLLSNIVRIWRRVLGGDSNSDPGLQNTEASTEEEEVMLNAVTLDEGHTGGKIDTKADTLTDCVAEDSGYSPWKEGLRTTAKMYDVYEQVVLFGNLGEGAVKHQWKAESVYAVVDVAGACYEEAGVVEVRVVLDGCAWDAALVQEGYKWELEALWVVELGVDEGQHYDVHRLFPTIGRLATAGSTMIVTYGKTELAVDEIEKRRLLEKELKELVDAPGWDVQYGARQEEFADAGGLIVLKVVEICEDDNEKIASSDDGTGVETCKEFQEYMRNERRMVRFELKVSPMLDEMRKCTMLVIGSEDCVGCWDPSRAQRMVKRADEGDDVFEVECLMNSKAQEVEYKYAAFNEHSHVLIWEQGGNRNLQSITKGHDNNSPPQLECVRDEWRHIA